MLGLPIGFTRLAFLQHSGLCSNLVALDSVQNTLPAHFISACFGHPHMHHIANMTVADSHQKVRIVMDCTLSALSMRPVLACYGQKRSEAAPFGYCIILLGHISIPKFGADFSSYQMERA